MKCYPLAIGVTCLLGSCLPIARAAPAKAKPAKKAPPAKKPAAKPVKDPVQTYISSTRDNLDLTSLYLMILVTGSTNWTSGTTLYESARQLGTLDTGTKQYDPKGPEMKKALADNLKQIKDLRASINAIATAKPVPAKFTAFQTAFANFEKSALPALAELEHAFKAEDNEKATAATAKVKALREPFDKLDKDFTQLATVKK